MEWTLHFSSRSRHRMFVDGNKIWNGNEVETNTWRKPSNEEGNWRRKKVLLHLLLHSRRRPKWLHMSIESLHHSPRRNKPWTICFFSSLSLSRLFVDGQVGFYNTSTLIYRVLLCLFSFNFCFQFFFSKKGRWADVCWFFFSRVGCNRHFTNCVCVFESHFNTHLTVSPLLPYFYCRLNKNTPESKRKKKNQISLNNFSIDGDSV